MFYLIGIKNHDILQPMIHWIEARYERTGKALIKATSRNVSFYHFIKCKQSKAIYFIHLTKCGRCNMIHVEVLFMQSLTVMPS